MQEKFRDRHEAGKLLAQLLPEYANKANTIVLALPRGGVPVAYEIANALTLPLDVFTVRKLGVPGHEELAMGAIATGDVTLFNEHIIHEFHVSQSAIDATIEVEKKELKRRESNYRENKPLPELQGKTIILVDDGIATGATLRVAIKALKQYKPAAIVAAIPVAALSSYHEMAKEVDQMTCYLKPDNLYAVAAWYENFRQTSDSEIAELLKNR